MKGIFTKITRLIAPALLTVALLLSLGSVAFAEEENAENGMTSGEYIQIAEEIADVLIMVQQM